MQNIFRSLYFILHFRPAKSIQADREISFNIRNVQNNDSPKSVQMSKPVKEVQNTIQPEIKPVSHDQLEEEVDDRPVNRRSPNGFLLPDPLPKGELLADSQKQVNLLIRKHKKTWNIHT